MSFVIYNPDTMKQLRLQGPYSERSYETVRTARAVLTKAINSGKVPAGHKYIVASYAAYTAADPIVETYNMLDPERKPVPIRKSLLGGCCDPATETYHSM